MKRSFENMETGTPSTSSVNFINTLHNVLLSTSQPLFDSIDKKHKQCSHLKAIPVELDDYYEQCLRAVLGNDTNSHCQSGSDEIRVNFAGQKQLTLQRSLFFGPHAKRSLLSMLFDARWQAALPKDRDGRVYLDIDYEWIKPVLDEYEQRALIEKKKATYKAKIKDNTGSVEDERSGATKKEDQDEDPTLILFESLLDYPFEARYMWACDFRGFVCDQRSGDDAFSFFLFEFLKKLFNQSASLFEKENVYSIQAKTSKWPKSTSTGKFLLLGFAEDKWIAAVFDCSTSRGCLSVLEKNNCVELRSIVNGTISDGSGSIQFGQSTILWKQENLNLNWNNIYSFTLHATPAPLSSKQFEFICDQPDYPSSLLKGVYNNLFEVTNTLQRTSDELDMDIALHKTALQQKLVEARLVECFAVHNSMSSFVLSPKDDTLFRPMHDPRYFKEHVAEDADLCELIRESYARIAAMAAPLKQRQQSDNIVCFNVGGESVCALRSSIVSALPESQLAIRVSGEWTEQESTLDSEGRLIVGFPRSVFLPLLHYVRAASMLGTEFVPNRMVVVSNLCARLAQSMFDYLSIEGVLNSFRGSIVDDEQFE